MENKKQEVTLQGCLGSIIAVLVFELAAGLIVQYGWNHIVSVTFGIQEITMWQAAGLDVLVTFITGNPFRKTNDKSQAEIYATLVTWYFMMFLLIYAIANMI